MDTLFPFSISKLALSLALALMVPPVVLAATGADVTTGTQLGTLGTQMAKGIDPNTTASRYGASATPGQAPTGGPTSAQAGDSTTITVDCSATTWATAPVPVDPLGIDTQCIAVGNGVYDFRFCPLTQSGSNCNSGGWETASGGANSTLNPDSALNVTVGSCPNDRCALSVAQSGSFSGDGSSLASQGQQAQTAGYADNNSITSDTLGAGVYTDSGQVVQAGKNSNSGDYAGSILSNGATLDTCMQQQQGAIANGQDVFTCGGTDATNFGTQSCASTQTCLQWTSTTSSWTETCDSTINLAQDTCETKTPSYQCTLADTPVTETCSNTTTPQLASTMVLSCTPGQTIAMWSVGDGWPYGADLLSVWAICPSSVNATSMQFNWKLQWSDWASRDWTTWFNNYPVWESASGSFSLPTALQSVSSNLLVSNECLRSSWGGSSTYTSYCGGDYQTLVYNYGENGCTTASGTVTCQYNFELQGGGKWIWVTNVYSNTSTGTSSSTTGGTLDGTNKPQIGKLVYSVSGNANNDGCTAYGG